MATEMRDTKLLAKLSVGDMTASDALYHKKCHTALHTRYRSFVRKNTKGSGHRGTFKQSRSDVVFQKRYR